MRYAAWVLGLVATLVAGAARAESELDETAPDARAAVSTFYRRLGVGAGVFVGPEDEDVGFYTGFGWGSTVISTTTVGLSIPVEIALGGRLGEHLVLGGGVYLEAVPLLDGYSNDPRVVGALAPFIDYYFDDQAGFHLQALAGIGATIGEEFTPAPCVGAGFGYEWAVGSTENAGVLVRSLALIAETPTFTPGVLFTFTSW